MGLMGILKMFGLTALEKARAEVERIAQARDRLDASRREAIAQKAHLERSRAGALTDALLAESNGSDPLAAAEAIERQISAADTRIQITDQTEAELVERLAQAMRHVIQCEADEADAIARARQAELDQHLAKLQPHLDAAAEIDGCEFVSRSVSLQIQHDLMTRIPGTTLAQPVAIPMTHTTRYATAVHNARSEAQRLRSRTVRTSGNVNGTLEQLLEQLRAPLWITPSEASLRHWAEGAAAHAEAKWKASGDNLLAEKAPWYNGVLVLYSVAWKDGVITTPAERGAKIDFRRDKTIQVPETQFVTHTAAYGS
jgi:hypothetical protein